MGAATTLGGRSKVSRPMRDLYIAGRWIKQNRSSVGLVPAIALVLIVGSQTSPAFLTRGNIVSVLQASAVLGVLVVAESIVLLAGRFDLSLESTVGFAPMLGVWLLAVPAAGGIHLLNNPWVGLAVVLAAGTAVGLVNGLAVVLLKLNPFMFTLAMLILLRGLTYWMTNGATITGPPSQLVFLGQQIVWSVPIEVFLVIGLYVAMSIIMRRHRFGRGIYALGGSEEAARAAGLPVNRLVISAYALAGCLASVSGLILMGQVNAVTTEQGNGLIFTVFAAAVIGGVSLQGGRGTLAGAGLGVLFLGLLSNALTLAQVPSQIIQAAQGMVIIVALVLNRLTVERE